MDSEENQNRLDLSLQEMILLEKAISDGESDMWNARMILENIQRKQQARRQELGFQKARIGMRLSKVSHAQVDGARMVVVQTDAGISTRWVNK